MKQYTPDSHWFILQFLPILPLLVIVLVLRSQPDALWITVTTLIIFGGYLLVTGYQVYLQIRYPMISTTDQGIVLHKHGNGDRHIQWDAIKGIRASSFCIKLDLKDEQEAIPTNALGDGKKAMLLNEILSRTGVHVHMAA